MITNARQYLISERKLKECLSQRRRLLHRIQKSLNAGETQKEIDDLHEQAELITKEMKEYIALSAGRIAAPDLSKISNLPNNLICARIALGWSQKEFARRVRVVPSQVHLWESTQYKSVSLSRVLAVATLLNSALTRQDQPLRRLGAPLELGSIVQGAEDGGS